MKRIFLSKGNTFRIRQLYFSAERLYFPNTSSKKDGGGKEIAESFWFIENGFGAIHKIKPELIHFSEIG